MGSHAPTRRCFKISNASSYTLCFSTPRIQSLSYYPDSPNYQYVSDHAILPSLEELELILVYGQWVWFPVVNLILRSGVTLRKFGVVRSDRILNISCLDPVELVQILKMSQFLELWELWVDDPIIGDHVVKFLTLSIQAMETNGGLVTWCI